MKETGIIMSGNHSKLILDGIKTQTRRVIKDQPSLMDKAYYSAFRRDFGGRLCPYGQVGDRLWVRETYKFDAYYDNRPPRDIPEGVTVECLVSPDAVHTEGNGHRQLTLDPGKWRPSIHMPRWASRITLEITEVRVERLQEITYEDAKAEGILRFDRDNPDADGGMGYNRGATGLPMRYESTTAFMDLWNSLNAKRGYGWDTNPWVWVLSFKIL